MLGGRDPCPCGFGPALHELLPARRPLSRAIATIALFSDIRSNLPALEAVLADIARTGVDAMYALGDLVGYAPWPNEVLDRLQADGIPSAMGNYDDGTRAAVPGRP